jgi:hypothetical protein
VALIVLGMIANALGNPNGAGSSTLDLNARVRFDGEAFHINNMNSYSWSNCRLSINGDYEFRADQIPGGNETTIEALRFTKSDGERFNPLVRAAKHIHIYCRWPDGRTGSWSFDWSG